MIPAPLLAAGAAVVVLALLSAGSGVTWPIRGPFRITSGYGPRRNPFGGRPSFHSGLDVAVPMGTPIYPIAPGVVVAVSHDHPSAGGSVTVEHPGRGLRSRYSHLSRVGVRVGTQVGPGAPLGGSGGKPGTRGAGRSTGPHLHLVTWRRDFRARTTQWFKVDPMSVL